jgi:hypothetical protein
MPENNVSDRARLLHTRAIIQRHERNGRGGAEMMRGARYELAVSATDVNGDRCMFPACGCPLADCARQPLRQPLVSWDDVHARWKLL